MILDVSRDPPLQPPGEITHGDIARLAVLRTVQIASVKSLAHVDHAGLEVKVLFLKTEHLRDSQEAGKRRLDDQANVFGQHRFIGFIAPRLRNPAYPARSPEHSIRELRALSADFCPAGVLTEYRII